MITHDASPYLATLAFVVAERNILAAGVECNGHVVSCERFIQTQHRRRFSAILALSQFGQKVCSPAR